MNDLRDHETTYGHEMNLLRAAGEEIPYIGEIYIQGKIMDFVRPAARLHVTSDLFFQNLEKRFAREFSVSETDVEILLTANIHPHSSEPLCLDCPTEKN